MIVFCFGVLASCRPEVPPQSALQSLVAEAGCDVRRGCDVQGEKLHLTVRMGPSVRVLQPFPVSLHVDTGAVEEIYVLFTMQNMDMGWNRYRLERAADGDWHAEVTLPVCSSGRSDWLAAFELVSGGERSAFVVPFAAEK